MVKPGVVAVSGPLITGIIFRRIGIASGRELLGAKCVASFLMFATASGILMALFLNTAGGAWDNAKKYVGNWIRRRERERNAQSGGHGRHRG